MDGPQRVQSFASETATPGIPRPRFSKVVLGVLYAAACVPLLVGSCGLFVVARHTARHFSQLGLSRAFYDRTAVKSLTAGFGFFGDMILLGVCCFALPWCLSRNRRRSAYWVTVAMVLSLGALLVVSYLDR